MANKMLEREEELQLIKLVQEGKVPEYALQDAMYRIYNAQQSLIKSIARRYANDRIQVEDLISVGYMGLAKAVKKYDPTKNVKLATHAYMWIRNEIERSLPELGWMIQTPYNMKEDYGYLQLLSDNYLNEHGHKPSSQELAKLANWKIKKVIKTLECGKGVSSLDHIIDNGANKKTSVEDLISDDTNIEKDLIQKEQTSELRQLVQKLLPQRMCEMLWLQTGSHMKISDIAKRYGISSARVKQILKQAKDTLQNNEEFKELWSNWE